MMTFCIKKNECFKAKCNPKNNSLLADSQFNQKRPMANKPKLERIIVYYFDRIIQNTDAISVPIRRQRGRTIPTKNAVWL